MPLTVNVAILSYNRAAYLAEAVDSLFTQTLPPERILVFDNGSDESVAEAIRPWIESGQVLWRGSETNRGVHWNLARAFSQGGEGSDCLFVMHDDDRLCPAFLERQTAFLDENPRVVAVACNAYEIDGEGRRLGSLLHNPKRREAREFFPDLPSMVRLYTKTFMAFPSVVYRSDAADAAPVRAEFGQLVDVVLLTELARRGTLAYVNEPLWEYRVHGGQDSSSFRERDWLLLENYYRERAREFPELKFSVAAYLARRRLSRLWKRLRRGGRP
ncbi:glycosyltransferase family 2 protein [Aminirod propionatiphilus]|uniref:Glycosyltransferase family 2 protein n=1 Tax=Aminirod propionatiphilus TaxID=3415223 RepID=A0ACD1DXI0_9BACT|nr:glycosyltransferase family 2 protein [Synergistota bacterium]